MSERTALEHLGRMHGIVPDYYDIWGRHHVASDATLIGLLAAMGVAADTTEKIERAIHAQTLAHWRRVLPQTVVVRDHAAPWTLRLNLPDRLARENLWWRLTQEDAQQHQDAIDTSALSFAENFQDGDERITGWRWTLPRGAPPGYHRLEILSGESMLVKSTLIVVPERCYRPPALEGDGRVWGAAVQLYAVRSARNWGIGDFTDLATIFTQWGERGAGVVGVNPLHALYLHDPEHASPYSPSSRAFVNPLYLDVEAIPDFAECDAAQTHVKSRRFQARLKRLRDAALVDYAGVATAKLTVIEHCYAHFRARHLASATVYAASFRAWQAAQGAALRRFALFQTLQEHFHRLDPGLWSWKRWPEPYRDPRAPEVAAFEAERAVRVEFYEYLQWQCERQLAAVGQRSMELDYGVGLYLDLAVSVDGNGAEAWSDCEVYAKGASVGAPPDDFNLQGQNWGLPPYAPAQLSAAAYAPFIATLRAGMHYAGALRIDHVMGLSRLFWIPEGGKAADGAYVHYPFDDLLGIVALESQRNRCLVIGEDLGTVPDEIRERLARAGAFSYRVLMFEREHDGGFKPPHHYPADALATVTTHDLPTLAGYWSGEDLRLRTALGHLPEGELPAQLESRARDRSQLIAALAQAGLLPEGASASSDLSHVLAGAIYAFLARSQARVMVAQLEDVLGVIEQMNLPGTTVEYANWRRRLPLELERFPDDERFAELTRRLAELRPRRR
jgi:(1->4)-alpha-D-glucan 1-alpha-D-glucosylmutase